MLLPTPLFLPRHPFSKCLWGGGTAFLHPYQVTHLHFLTSLGFVAQRGSEGEFSLDEPNLLPSLPCCDSKEESVLVDSALWSEAVFHALHGAQWVPALSRLCDCCPEGQCSLLPSWSCLLFSEHCSCSDTESHSKALQSPSVGRVLWSTFAKEKVTGEEGGRESNTHLMLDNSPTVDCVETEQLCLQCTDQGIKIMRAFSEEVS